MIEDVPRIEEKPDAPETETKTQDKLLELIRDEAFFIDLANRVAELQKAGIKEKNIVGKDIKRVKRIRIGDKDYTPNDVYDRKNIVEGKVEDAEELIVGDGH